MWSCYCCTGRHEDCGFHPFDHARCHGKSEQEKKQTEKARKKSYTLQNRAGGGGMESRTTDGELTREVRYRTLCETVADRRREGARGVGNRIKEGGVPRAKGR